MPELISLSDALEYSKDSIFSLHALHKVKAVVLKIKSLMDS
jgi:hypothetical protein